MAPQDIDNSNATQNDDLPPIIPGEGEGGRRYLPRGTNLSRLKFLRRKVKEELGEEYIQNLHKEYFLIDLIFNVLLPCTVAPYFLYKTMHWDLYYPPLLMFYMIFGGFLGMQGAGCFHDLTHRLPGGYVCGRFLAKLSAIWGPRMGEVFYKRHQFHHARMFEVGDAKIRRFRTNHANSNRRMKTVFPIINAFTHNKVFHDQMNDSSMKVNKKLYAFEQLTSVAAYFWLTWMTGTWWGMWRIFLIYIGVHFWNSLRECLEHSGQDMHDDLAQGTFVVLPVWFKWMWWSMPMGNCHHYHHIFPKAPNYQILWRSHEMDDLMRKLGIREKSSVWHLMYDYYIKRTPYASCEPSSYSSKKLA